MYATIVLALALLPVQGYKDCSDYQAMVLKPILVPTLRLYQTSRNSYITPPPLVVNAPMC